MRSIFHAQARATRRKLRLPKNACCVTCGRADAIALLPDARPLVCVDCNGLAKPEDHHPLGIANDPDLTIPLRPSTHRFFTDRQEDWPTTTLINVTGSPHVRTAAMLRSLADIMAYLEECVLAMRARELLRRHGGAVRG